MSTESHNTGQEPRHTDVSFEPRDIQTGTIYGYLVALAVAVIASFLLCIYILRFAGNFAASTEAPPPPSRAAMGKSTRIMPPEPRLQGVPGHEVDPQADLRAKNLADNEANEKLEWVDKSNGIAQIPVKDAMKLIAEKGLPSVPAAEKKK
jgi:7-keto-8-aminopelargonate synthetase-like enzyme